MRSRQLRATPYCPECERATPPRLVLATVCHHMQAHRGDARLFWDPANVESVYASGHDREIQGVEVWGYSTTLDADGPVDPSHPFHVGRR
jgi:5-methylcytosine-specific restriction enzyme A